MGIWVCKKFSAHADYCLCGRRAGRRCVGQPEAAGQRPRAGCRGPRAAGGARISSFVIDKVGSGRWRAPPSGLPVRQRRRPRGLQRGDRAPYLGYWGLPRVPFLKPGDVCTKNMPRAAVCCPLRGNHLRIGTRVLILLCRNGCVPRHPRAAFRPWSMHGMLKGCPVQDLGAFPRLILSLPVARTRLLSSIPRGRAQPEASSKKWQGPNQAAAFVERIAVVPQNCSKYYTHRVIELCRAKRCLRSVE